MTTGGVCCFTGHRNYEKAATELEGKLLRKLIDNAIRFGYTTFKAGGALGFDTVVAEYILQKRAEGLPVRLELVLPCADQAARWGETDRRRYEAIKRAADKVECLHDRYVDGCMQERNRRMVDESSLCIAYCNQPSGGTAGTVRYAKQKGIPVYNICEMAAGMPKM